MRRLVSFSEAANDRYADMYDLTRDFPASFFEGKKESGYLIDHADAIGVYAYRREEDTVFLSLYLTDPASLSSLHLVQRLLENIFRKEREKKVVVKDGSQYGRLLSGCGFYPKGQAFQKIYEPWKFVVPDACFDEEGYLINQGRMEKIPFGWFNTRDKGCGWIAAYNFLRLLGKETDMQEIEQSLSRHSLLGKAAGQEIGSLYLWLNRKVPCHYTYKFKKNLARTMAQSQCGILLYVHSQGAHYVAYKNLKNGTFHFYNAAYGKKDHEEKAESFLERFAMVPGAALIWK